MNLDEVDSIQEASGTEHEFLTKEDRYFDRQNTQESIDVLISELSRRSPVEIRALFDKIAHVGGKEALDALEFIGNLSQA